MENLNAGDQLRIALAPTSQSPGNTVADQAALAMTAPGSESVNPVPTVVDNVPQPRPSSYSAPNRERAARPGRATPAWTGAGGHGTGVAKPWTEA